MNNYNTLLEEFITNRSITETEKDILNENLKKIPEKKRKEVIEKLNEMAVQLLKIDAELNGLETDDRFKSVLTATQINHTFRILQYNTLFNYILQYVPQCEKIISKMVNDLNQKLILNNSIIARKIRMKTLNKAGVFIDRSDAMAELQRIITSGIDAIKSSKLSSIEPKSGDPSPVSSSPSSPVLSPLTSPTLDPALAKASTPALAPALSTAPASASVPFPRFRDALKKHKGGGDVNNFRDSYLEQKLKKLVKIYNTDVMLKLANIISNPDEFETFFTKIYSKRYDVSVRRLFINNFFLEISNDELIKFLNIKSNIERDTLIVHNILDDDDKNYIYVFQFVNKLATLDNKKLQKLLFTDEVLSELGFILESIIQKVANLKNDYNNIQKNTFLISDLYDQILKKSKRIFTYVKKRLDSGEKEGERFKFTNLEDDTVLKLDYKNTYQDNDNLSGATNETYYFGSFDNIFNPEISNKEIAKTMMKDLLPRINNKEDVCIIGYGASGAGKTSTLVRLNTQSKVEDGIILELLKLPELTKTLNIKRIIVTAIEIMINPGKKPSNQNVNENQYLYRDLVQLQETLDIFDALEDAGQKKQKVKMLDLDVNGEFIDTTANELTKLVNKIAKEKNLINLIPPDKIEFIYNKTHSKLMLVDELSESISFNITNNDGGWYMIPFKDENIKSGNLSKNGIDTKKEIEFSFEDNWRHKENLESSKLEYFKKTYNLNIKDKVNEIILGDYINALLKLRKEKPTPNNPNSSRSHVVVKMDLFKGDESEKYSSIILCDFAGVENQFLCNDENTLTKFINAYKKSTVEFPYANYPSDETTVPKVSDELFNFWNEKKKNNNGNIGGVEYCIDRVEGYVPIKDESNPQISKLINNISFYKNMIEVIESNEQDLTSETSEFVKNNFFTQGLNYSSPNNNGQKIGENVLRHYFIDKTIPLIRNKQDSITKIKEMIETANTEIIKLEVTTGTYDKFCQPQVNKRIVQKCAERLSEGYLINHSLKGMREDVKDLLLSSIKGEAEYLPIFSDTSIYPYCRNLFLDNEYFSTFYDAKNTEFEPSQQIVKLFKNLGLDTGKLIFVLLTVINLNTSANNPPPVPYFNVSPLIYYLESKNIDKAESEYGKLSKQIESYKNQKIYVNIIEDILKNQTSPETLASYLKKTNAATLIGSLESTVMLQSLTFSQFSCTKMEDIPDTIDFLNEVGFPIDLVSEQKYFKKYLKYKQKYQLLKNKL
jgi:hypothetical protein